MKAKTLKLKEEYERSTGLPYQPNVSRQNSSRITKILMNAVLVFSGVYGTLLFYTSSFEIHFNELIVGVVILLLSLYTAFLYYSNLVKNIGYIILFIAFVGMVLLFRTYVNSGFAAIYNITYDGIDKVYSLPSIRHTAEQIKNRYESITICLCFLGTVGAILLNTGISSSMSLWRSLLATFPIIAIALYFDQTPSIISVFLLIIFYVTLIVLKHDYSIASSIPFLKNKKNRRKIICPSDGKWMGQMMLTLFLVLTILYLLFSLILPRRSFHVPQKWSAYKEQIDDRLRTFMIVGFSGLMNRYDAKGGVNGGRLGGIASIRPTFETDLRVRFAPYDLNTVYLKSFTGTDYQYDHWETTQERTDTSDKFSTLSNFTYNEYICNSKSDNYKLLFENGKDSVIKGKMEIENVNANVNFPYLPYYSYVTNSDTKQCTSDGIVVGNSPIGKTDTLTFYKAFNENPNIIDFSSWGYLNVPRSLYSPLKNFCNEIELNGTDEQIIQQVIDYFKENYPYSTSPGATPMNKDFVNYFLFENKKGYCAHFASAATLLFRTMDIPARYVEGYVIPYETVIDSNLVDGELYEDWIEGNTPLGKTAVIEAEVTDAMAHSWVEVCLPNGSWVPVEVTPSSFLSQSGYSDFWSFFKNIFGNDENVNNNANTNLPIFNQNNWKVLYRILIIIVLAVFTFFLFLQVYLHIKRYFSFHTENKNTNLSNRYQVLCKLFLFAYSDFASCHDQKQQIEWMSALFVHQFNDWNGVTYFNELESTLKKACYSPYEITEKEYEHSVQTMRQIRRWLYRSTNVYIKVRMTFR